MSPSVKAYLGFLYVTTDTPQTRSSTWGVDGGAGGWLSATPGSLSSYSIISPLRPQLQSIGKVGPSLRSEEQLEEMTGREVTRRGSPAHCCRADVALMGSPGVQEFPEAAWVRNRPRLSRDTKEHIRLPPSGMF